MLEPAIRAHFRLNFLSIALLGQQPLTLTDPAHAKGMAIAMGARPDRICLIDVPSGPKGAGFQTVQLPDFTAPIQAEGTILRLSGSAATLQTRDCPTVVLYDGLTHRTVVTHAGRPALTPPADCAACSFSVLDAAYQQLRGHEKGDRHVRAFILGSICGHCFVHDEPGAEAYVTPFDRFGEAIFTDRSKGALDLVKHIRTQLEHKGIPPENIVHDKLCTKEDERLSSRRGGRCDTKNTIIVVRH